MEYSRDYRNYINYNSDWRNEKIYYLGTWAFHGALPVRRPGRLQLCLQTIVHCRWQGRHLLPGLWLRFTNKGNDDEVWRTADSFADMFKRLQCFEGQRKGVVVHPHLWGSVQPDVHLHVRLLRLRRPVPSWLQPQTPRKCQSNTIFCRNPCRGTPKPQLPHWEPTLDPKLICKNKCFVMIILGTGSSAIFWVRALKQYVIWMGDFANDSGYRRVHYQESSAASLFLQEPQISQWEAAR